MVDPHAQRPNLNPIEQRVIGALLEKERTVPASYPMTLNALRTACNQSSSRSPVVDYDDRTITAALDDLKALGLARMVYASHGSRTVKYRQVLDEVLEMEPDERAAITVLLLRGPTAAGELKTRSERLHRFADRDAAEACLTRLRDREVPLVQELPRQVGQHDTRWIHLLGPVDVSAVDDGGGRRGPAVAVTPATPGPEVTEAILSDGALAREHRVIRAYDAVAEAYALALLDELDAKPLDRWLLERVADLADGGPVADAGCGPGHVGFHLAAADAAVTGFDLSSTMIEVARRNFPELSFEVADLTALPAPVGGGGWSAIVAWYSLVHLAGSELRPAVALMAATLRPGGWLAFAVHLGPELRHVDELFGVAVDVDFVLHDPEQVLEAVTTAGLVDVEWYRRGPYPGGEVATERLYVLARRPALT